MLIIQDSSPQLRKDFGKINSAIDTYNDLVANLNEYSASIAKEVENTLLLVDFLLVETNPIETKAFWHYPLRSGDYEEEIFQKLRNS